ncbi:hypothetical protein THRCLA_02098 [Thraustotheca clavata]|uniref:Uncharacterized protein n=1 Tax=Thraustotheca clavata TaxID=74557 RepID=A0A1W0A6Z8_9STRA|nr:hypothetical protein THRCLA_02098 [Thraustotheca clavata]
MKADNQKKIPWKSVQDVEEVAAIRKTLPTLNELSKNKNLKIEPLKHRSIESKRKVYGITEKPSLKFNKQSLQPILRHDLDIQLLHESTHRIGKNIPIQFLKESNHTDFALRMATETVVRILTNNFYHAQNVAFQKWMGFTLSARAVEHALKLKHLEQLAGLARCLSILQLKVDARIRQCIHNWHDLAKRMTHLLHSSKVLMIQCAWRQSVARSIRKALQEARIFKLQQTCAIHTQRLARGFVARQKFYRQLLDYRRNKAALRIQHCFRSHVIYKGYLFNKQTNAAGRIQRNFRGYLGRQKAIVRREEIRCQSEIYIVQDVLLICLAILSQRIWSTIRIQRCFRHALARCNCQLAYAKLYTRRRYFPARSIQQTWQMYKNRVVFCTAMDIVNGLWAIKVRLESRYNHNVQARLIYMRHRAAITIQRYARGYLAKCFVQPLIDARYAELNKKLPKGCCNGIGGGVQALAQLEAILQRWKNENAIKIQQVYRGHIGRFEAKAFRLAWYHLLDVLTPVVVKFLRKQLANRVRGRWIRKRRAGFAKAFLAWKGITNALRQVKTDRSIARLNQLANWHYNKVTRKTFLRRWSQGIILQREMRFKKDLSRAFGNFKLQIKSFLILHEHVRTQIVNHFGWSMEMKIAIFHAWKLRTWQMHRVKSMERIYQHRLGVIYMEKWLRAYCLDHLINRIGQQNHHKFTKVHHILALRAFIIKQNKINSMSRRNCYNFAIREWIYTMCQATYDRKQAQKGRHLRLKLCFRAWKRLRGILLANAKLNATAEAFDKLSKHRRTIVSWICYREEQQQNKVLYVKAHGLFKHTFVRHAFDIWFKLWASTAGKRRLEYAGLVAGDYGEENKVEDALQMLKLYMNSSSYSTRMSVAAVLKLELENIPRLLLFWQGRGPETPLYRDKALKITRRFTKVPLNNDYPLLKEPLAPWLSSLFNLAHDKTAIDIQAFARRFITRCQRYYKIQRNRFFACNRIVLWFVQKRRKRRKRNATKLQLWYRRRQEQYAAYLRAKASIASYRKPIVAFQRTLRRHFCRRQLQRAIDERHANVELYPDAPLCLSCEVKIAFVKCNECDEPYCDGCFENFHSSGNRVAHSSRPIDFKAMQRNAFVCTDCSINETKRVCKECNKGYCTHCYDKLHTKLSGRSTHKYIRAKVLLQPKSNVKKMSKILACDCAHQVMENNKWKSYRLLEATRLAAEKAAKAIEERLKAIEIMTQLLEKPVLHAFQVYDPQHCGFVGPGELKMLLRKELCIPLSSKQLQNGMNTIDQDNNGKFEWKEICLWLAQMVVDHHLDGRAKSIKRSILHTQKKYHTLRRDMLAFRKKWTPKKLKNKKMVPHFDQVAQLHPQDDFHLKKNVFYRYIRKEYAMEWLLEDVHDIDLEDQMHVFATIFVPYWNKGQLGYEYYYDGLVFQHNNTMWEERWNEKLEKYTFFNIATAAEHLVDPRKEEMLYALAFEAFHQVDTDGSGQVDIAELHRLLNENLCEPVSMEQTREIMKDIDKDGTGTINFEEFYNWYGSEYSQQCPKSSKHRRLQTALRTRRHAKRLVNEGYSKSVQAKNSLVKSIKSRVEQRKLAKASEGADPQTVELLIEGFNKGMIQKGLMLHQNNVAKTREWLLERQEEAEFEAAQRRSELQKRRQAQLALLHSAQASTKAGVKNVVKAITLLIFGEKRTHDEEIALILRDLQLHVNRAEEIVREEIEND